MSSKDLKMSKSASKEVSLEDLIANEMRRVNLVTSKSESERVGGKSGLKKRVKRLKGEVKTSEETLAKLEKRDLQKRNEKKIVKQLF